LKIMSLTTPSTVRELPPATWGRVRQSRRVADKSMRIITASFTVIAISVLFWILGMLIVKGIGGLSVATFTQITPGPGSEGGGLANAIVGSVILTFLGIVVATPIGVLAGTYLAEYGKGSMLADLIRFINDILLSAPSILIGLFIYQLVVLPMGAFSGIAGALALAIIVIPVVVRTTEDMLQLIPNTLREAVIGLGAPKWKMITLVCYKAALSGIVTGILLAVARIAGETAPLLLTSFGNNVTSLDLTKAMASLPIAIYQQANSGFPDLIAIAWAGALLITVGVLAINIVARVLLRTKT
jgi:phosphate transport system permease protein